MSSKPSGLQNYDKLEDKDKAYIIKLLSSIVSAILGGIITGSIYSGDSSKGGIGFLIFFGFILGSSYYTKVKFELKEMSDVKIIRHGIVVSLLVFIFLWTAIYQFYI